jgi:hypothetical protein
MFLTSPFIDQAFTLRIHQSGNYSRMMVSVSIYQDISLRPLLSASVQARKPDGMGKEYLYVWCGLSLSLL